MFIICTSENVYPTPFFSLHSDHFIWPQGALRSPLFHFSANQVRRGLVQC